MTYFDADGNLYTLTESPWGFRVYQQRRTRVASGDTPLIQSKEFDVVAPKPDWVPYPDVICTTCAESAGKKWPDGHLGTFSQVPCDICKEVVSCTEPRDWGHFNTVEELKALYRIARKGQNDG